ncbi:MarR family transcriptional regulator [Halorubellus sp. JP-L1]|nr:MarR family transcriptional regulator [Halorubellus sp. JP-L1]
MDADADATTGADATTDAGGVDGDPVEVGVELLAKAEDAELSLAEAMDRVEAVSTAPTVVREILDTAEMRGVIDREDGVVDVRGSGYVSQTSDVVRRDGDYDCRRCGTGLSTGHFVQLDAGELGPFGSECVRKVTGRAD